MVPGHYGEFKVLVDGQLVIDGGKLAVVGIVPSGETVVAAVRERLSK